jgi:hypothetical protein
MLVLVRMANLDGHLAGVALRVPERDCEPAPTGRPVFDDGPGTGAEDTTAGPPTTRGLTIGPPLHRRTPGRKFGGGAACCDR